MEVITQFSSTQSLQKRYFPFIHFCDRLINLQSRHIVRNTANVTTLQRSEPLDHEIQWKEKRDPQPDLLITRCLESLSHNLSSADDAFEIRRDPSEVIRRQIRTPPSWRDEADTSGEAGCHHRLSPPGSGAINPVRRRRLRASLCSLFTSGSNGIRWLPGTFEPGRLYPGPGARS